MEKYGVENPLQNNSIKAKCLATMKDKYGVEYPMQSEDFKDKIKKTNLNKFGTEWASQNKDISEKQKQTTLDRYGVKYYAQTEEYKEKAKQTNLDKYGKESYTQTEEFKEKTKETNLERYGVEHYSQTDEFKEKIKVTCLERYGDENYNNPEKNKQTCLERYGVKYYTQTEDYLKKSYKTKKKNHTFNSSSIEKEFAKWLTENNFNFERQYRSEEYPFACDFYLIDYDLYIEIQGTWTHGEHPFDIDNEADKKILEKWNQKKDCHPYYLNAIDTWTKSDVEKRNVAKENNLNYLEIFSCKLDDCIFRLNERVKNIS